MLRSILALLVLLALPAATARGSSPFTPPVSAGDDTSVPGAVVIVRQLNHVRVGTASGPETRYPLHHARFDVTEGALPDAARLMADVIARRLS